MSDALVIAEGLVVGVHYTLKTDSHDVVDSSLKREEPLLYLHGAGNIVPGLEARIAGLGVGEKKVVDVPPEEGYGVRHDTNIQAVPRSEFPPDMEVMVGMPIGAQGPNGEQTVLWVCGTDEEGKVLLDINHPLSGETLHFDVEVVSIRPATDEEVTHGHPHFPGMHEH